MPASAKSASDWSAGFLPYIVSSLINAATTFIRTCSNSALISKFLLPNLKRALSSAGVEEERQPSAESFTTCLFAFATGLSLNILHWRRNRRLCKKLLEAEARLYYLREKLLKPSQKKEIRIFMDGAFDLLHYGHMNAFRLARSLGTHLVVGVNSDESITKCKGAPLMNDQERLALVSACKFVDEVLPDCPYIMSQEYLDSVIDKYSIDFVVHGDDPCIVDGKDVYESAKQAGKYQTIPRTEGVSTTDIVGRMLLMTKEHHYFDNSSPVSPVSRKLRKRSESIELLANHSKFLTTSRMLQLFSADIKAPTTGMRVIYIDGAWDLFHPGHVAVLKAARERGDYLFVGIHGDGVVNQERGMNLPLMNLHERVLSVLGCRYVDDVLIDAPYEITEDMIALLNISEVVCVQRPDVNGNQPYSSQGNDWRFRTAKEAGILTVLESPTEFNIWRIVERIKENHAQIKAKFESKMELERTFFRGKYQGNGNTSKNKILCTD